MQPTQTPTCTGIRVRTTRDANVLFHEEMGVMVIDFERARIGDAPREALAPVVPNKRPWRRGQGKEVTIDRQGFVREVADLEQMFAHDYS